MSVDVATPVSTDLVSRRNDGQKRNFCLKSPFLPTLENLSVIDLVSIPIFSSLRDDAQANASANVSANANERDLRRSTFREENLGKRESVFYLSISLPQFPLPPTVSDSPSESPSEKTGEEFCTRAGIFLDNFQPNPRAQLQSPFLSVKLFSWHQNRFS
jgi:hypothetical protein